MKSRTTVAVVSWTLFLCGVLGTFFSIDSGDIGNPVKLIALGVGGFWLLAYMDRER